jgi:GYD domain
MKRKPETDRCIVGDLGPKSKCWLGRSPHAVLSSSSQYTPEALAKLIGNPQDRFEAVRGPIEKLGGKIKDSYFAFGPYDAVLINA